MVDDAILEAFQDGTDKCYYTIKEKLEELGYNFHLRKEKHYVRKIFIYIIEVISPLRSKKDDYGITIDVQLRSDFKQIFCQIDVLKTNGPLYLEKEFEFSSQDNDLKIEGVKKSLEVLESLSDFVVDIYTKEYAANHK